MTRHRPIHSAQTDEAKTLNRPIQEQIPPVVDQPGDSLLPEERATEAARTGREDNSAQLGSDVSGDGDRMATGRPTTAGDPDAMTEQAKVVGEEAIGGTTPTPDQNNVDDIGTAMGLNAQPEHPLRVTREMHRRDEHRFELDPDSQNSSGIGRSEG